MAAARKVPAPKVVQTVCVVCGLDWAAHKGEKPGLDECVRLLMAELASARRPKFNTFSGTTFTPASSANMGIAV